LRPELDKLSRHGYVKVEPVTPFVDVNRLRHLWVLKEPSGKYHRKDDGDYGVYDSEEDLLSVLVNEYEAMKELAEEV
jgi:hypothetical protein